MVLRELHQHRHLFAHLFDNIWFALPGNDSQHPGIFAHDAIPFERRVLMDNGGFEPGTIGYWLVDTLRREGPARHVDLRDRVARELGASRASAGAILTTNPCFQRVAPGIYGLYDGPHDPVPADSIWINERQCRQYAITRFSGAPAGYFPAWTASYERALCTWARHRGSTDAFRSVMAVAAPETWNGDGTDTVDWMRIRQSKARWGLSHERRVPLGNGWPTPEAFVAALAHLVFFDSIGWCGANRTAQRKFDSSEGADVLALFIAMDLVVPPDHWQKPHAPTTRTREALECALQERWQRGELSWNEGCLADLLTGASARLSYSSLGWLDRDEADRFLKTTPRSQAGGRPRNRDDGTTLGELEELFVSEEWNGLFRPDGHDS
jgi:hypothetical protein